MASILLMEDDIQQSFFWSGKLRLAGHEVAAFERDPFDLLITDIFVKNEGELVPDGAFSLIRRVRAFERSGAKPPRQRLPIIVLSAGYTALRSEELFTQMRDIGADLCLAKPATSAALIEVIDHLLQDQPA